jgi:hypothetical protein
MSMFITHSNSVEKLQFQQVWDTRYLEKGISYTFPCVYRDSAHKLRNAPYVDNSYKWAGGGFLSNVQDLVKFGNAMLFSYQRKTDKPPRPASDNGGENKKTTPAGADSVDDTGGARSEEAAVQQEAGGGSIQQTCCHVSEVSWITVYRCVEIIGGFHIFYLSSAFNDLDYCVMCTGTVLVQYFGQCWAVSLAVSLASHVRHMCLNV